jgi:dUTP pyrophosphatase
MDYSLSGFSNVNELYTDLKSNSVNGFKNFAVLKLSVDDDELRDSYSSRVLNHNNQFMQNTLSDSGFDVLVPNEITFDQYFITKFIDMNIKTEMFYCNVETDLISTCAFAVHPRSSISKTPLMLANHTGIIDSGYRGSLIGAFRQLPHNQVPYNIQISEYTVSKNARLLQICHPSLCPIYIMLVHSNDLSSSERGDGGFGSTS